MKKFLLLLALSVISPIFSQTKPLDTEINNYIKEISEENNIPGVALAVIQHGNLRYRGFYGVSNLDYNIPVDENTLFPLFSTSKIFTTVGIHKLIEEDKIHLKDQVSEYLQDLPAPWKDITIEHLLTHSSGLPEIVIYEREPEELAKSRVYRDSINFSPGEQFDYNQTNFWLLNRIVKKILGTSLPEYIMTNQFAENSSALFEGNSLAIVEDRATSYSDYPVKGYLRETHYNNPPFLYGATGLNINLDDFIRWNTRFDHNEILNQESKQRLFTPFQFQTQRPYATGWYMDSVNNHRSYYYTGSFSTGFKKFPEKDLTIIFLTNGSQELLRINNIMKHIAGLVESELASSKG